MSKNWPNVRLGNVLTPADREEAVDAMKEYRLLGVRLEGQGPFLREVVTGTQTSATKLFRVEKGDFIYSRLFACRGAFGVISEDLDGCYVSSEFPTFLPIPGKIDVEFLRYWFRLPAVIACVDEDCSGSTPLTRNRFKEQFFLALEIPLPPLVEQRRIVARVEELSAKIHEARELRSHIKDETGVLFAKALARAFEPYTANMRSIGDVFSITTGGTPSRGNPAFWGGDVKWVSSGEVNFRTIDDTVEKITQHGVESSNGKVNPPGTVLLAMIGQGKTRGQCAILGCYAANNQNVAAIHVYKTPHKPEYVYWWLYSQYQQSRAVETGTAQPALSGERVKRIPIPIAPIEEQCRIVLELNDLQNKINVLKAFQAETSAELAALMPSILDKAFRGELYYSNL